MYSTQPVHSTYTGRGALPCGIYFKRSVILGAPLEPILLLKMPILRKFDIEIPGGISNFGISVVLLFGV